MGRANYSWQATTTLRGTRGRVLLLQFLLINPRGDSLDGDKIREGAPPPGQAKRVKHSPSLEMINSSRVSRGRARPGNFARARVRYCVRADLVFSLFSDGETFVLP